MSHPQTINGGISSKRPYKERQHQTAESTNNYLNHQQQQSVGIDDDVERCGCLCCMCEDNPIEALNVRSQILHLQAAAVGGSAGSWSLCLFSLQFITFLSRVGVAVPATNFRHVSWFCILVRQLSNSPIFFRCHLKTSL